MTLRKTIVCGMLLAVLACTACRPCLELTIPAGRGIVETCIAGYPAPEKRIWFTRRPMIDVLAELGAVAHKKYIHFVGGVNPYDKHVLGSGTVSTEVPLERVFYQLSDIVPLHLYIDGDTIVVENRPHRMAVR